MAEFTRKLTEAEYKKGIPTRVMPANLRTMGEYALRFMYATPRDGHRGAFAVEVAAIVDYVRHMPESSEVGCRLIEHTSAVEIVVLSSETLTFSPAGFVVVDNRGRFPAMPEEAEIGYFAGSQNPWDLGLAKLVEDSRHEQLVGAGR